MWQSLETLLISYAVAAKRSGIVVSVLVGALLFKEDVVKRLPYIMLMFAGMLIIIFSEEGHR
jgi:multidrug transporter EmrE-like cation transporter